MPKFTSLKPPTSGTPITRRDGQLTVPDDPIVPFIEGDGTGPDIWRASVRVFDAAVQKAFAGKRRLAWFEVLAGEKAKNQTGEWLPADTLEAVKAYKVAIKGPLTTPVRYFNGTPAPVTHPENMNVVIFRENTEDVYAGIEWARGTPQAERFIEFVSRELGKRIALDSGIGVKPISETGTKRLMRMAVRYALANGRKVVTIVHKGNIMKFTEGAFRDWAYEVAKAEFRDRIVTEEEAGGGAAREGKLLINDRIADSVFQQILTRTADYDVFATPNLNGAGGRPGYGARRERGGRDRVLRGDARHGAKVRGQGRHQSQLGDSFRRDDAQLSRVDRGRLADRKGARENDRAKEGHLRPRTSDGGRQRAEDVAVRGCDHQQYVEDSAPHGGRGGKLKGAGVGSRE